jgi:hypothetical protein
MQCKKLGREALCVYANGAAGAPDEEGNEDGERNVKRPRVEVSKLASWGNGDQNIDQNADQQIRKNGYLNQDPYLQTLAVGKPKTDNEEKSPALPGKVHIQGSRSKYIGLGDRMALLDHVSYPLLKNSESYISGYPTEQ